MTQHRPLVTDMKWKFVKQTKKTFTPKSRTWKLKDQNVTNLFKDRLTHLLASDIYEKSVVDQWMHLKTNLLKATEETCGISKQGKWYKQTWWWDNSVDNAVTKKGDFLRSGKKEVVKKTTL